MSRSRAKWAHIVNSRKEILKNNFWDDCPITSKAKRKSKEKEPLKVIPKHFSLKYTEHEINGDMHYISSAGAHIIVNESFVAVKMPYSMSANSIWRASIDTNTGVQRNSLSASARNYKTNIGTLYKALLNEIGFEMLNGLCEIRLIAQPPTRPKNYTSATHPRYDIDNYPKLIIDSLKGLLFKDDNIFISEKIKFAEPVEGGCVWVSCVLKEEKELDWIKHSVDFDWLAGRVV